MPSHVEVIREYYARIDANDTGWVLALFSPHAIYERAGALHFHVLSAVGALPASQEILT